MRLFLVVDVDKSETKKRIPLKNLAVLARIAVFVDLNVHGFGNYGR
jgi:hypothetical protein